MKKIALFVLLAFLLVACGEGNSEGNTAVSPGADAEEFGPGAGGGMMGRGQGMGGMMERHRAQVPEEYAGLTNPVPADEESLGRGEEIYGRLCASCHGDGGMGDGPAAENLDPAPAPIAHTSRMLGDDYLFWRVTEGGHDFETAMPAWDQALTEQERWDVINYVRAMGQGTAQPGQMRGGARFDPALEEEQRAEMLADAVEEEVITPAEADTFDAVHAAMDEWMAANADTMRGGMGRMQQEILDDLAASGRITEAQAETFNDVHERLLAAGLMR